MISRHSRDGGHWRICAALALCLAIAPNPGWTQIRAPAPLPLAAQEAFDKGIDAATHATTVPDYLLAVRFFEDARKLAPAAPILYFNLGVAEAKVPRRELRAIAWFGAYLAAYPAAPNAAAVRGRIAALAAANHAYVSSLIRAIEQAANEKAASEAGGVRTTDLNYDLGRLAAMQARSGDIAAAQINAGRILDGYNADSARLSIVMAQIRTGDFAGARKTAELVGNSGFQEGALSSIAQAQANTRAPIASSADWLSKLDDDDLMHDCPLNTAPFLDLAAYRQSLPSNTPKRAFDELRSTAVKLVSAQSVIDEMLKQQATQPQP
jgi:hypothetical protein